MPAPVRDRWRGLEILRRVRKTSSSLLSIPTPRWLEGVEGLKRKMSESVPRYLAVTSAYARIPRTPAYPCAAGRATWAELGSASISRNCRPDRIRAEYPRQRQFDSGASRIGRAGSGRDCWVSAEMGRCQGAAVGSRSRGYSGASAGDFCQRALSGDPQP